MPDADDQDLLPPLPELDGDTDEPTGDGEELALSLDHADEAEEVGLDDATYADEPIDPEWLDSLPDEGSLLGTGDQPPEGLDLGVELDAGGDESWVERGGREERWDEEHVDLDPDPNGGVAEDGGVLGLEDILLDDDLGDDEVDLPPLGGSVGPTDNDSSAPSG